MGDYWWIIVVIVIILWPRSGAHKHYRKTRGQLVDTSTGHKIPWKK